MTITPNVLVVSSDAHLRAELEAALAAVEERRAVLHFAADPRQGIEVARSRRPPLAVIEMGGDLRTLEAFAREVALVSPETTVAAVFRPDSFGADVSESAIFVAAVRAGVKDFLRRPISSQELESLLARVLRPRRDAARRLGQIVAFISNKGGVGKSTTAVNTACGLAARHLEQVLLVDASLQLGVCASMLDLAPPATILDAVHQEDRLDETLIRQLATPHRSGLHLLAAPEDAVEASEIGDESMARILTLARRSYDFVVVDTFPMIDRVNVAILDLSDRAYVVVENVVPTLVGAAKILELLDGLGITRERRRIVLNRYLKVPGSLALGDVADRLGQAIDWVLPFDRRVVVAANLGDPSFLSSGWFNQYSRRLRGLVGEIESMTAADGRAPEKESERADFPADQPADEGIR